MDGTTHAWIAFRAIGLMQGSGMDPNLIRLLKEYAKETIIGARLPDSVYMRKGTSKIENHVLKMEPFKGRFKKYYILDKDHLLDGLGKDRKMVDFLKNDSVLDDEWWKTAYKAKTPPGKHIANNAMALRTTILDLLTLGDNQVEPLVPGKPIFNNILHPNAMTRHEQVANYFFMLSHFIADAYMPCHCDKRLLSSYSKGLLHEQWEKRWGNKVTNFFNDEKIAKSIFTSDDLINEAIKKDITLGINFNNTIPKMKSKDLWVEMIKICRGSFALNSILCPEAIYPYNGNKLYDYSQAIQDPGTEDTFKELDKVILHDSVLTTAMAWHDIWKQFK